MNSTPTILQAFNPSSSQSFKLSILPPLGYYCMHRYVGTARDAIGCMRGATR